MSASKKLSEIVPLSAAQLLVLSDAAHRPDGVVVPPERLKGKAAVKVVQALIGKGLVREVRAKAGLPFWRDGETGRAFALVLTKLGRSAVPTQDIGPERVADEEPPGRPIEVPSPVREAAGGIEAEPFSAATAAGQHGAKVEEVHAEDAPKHSVPRPGSKLDAVIALLGRDTGASVDEIMAATGWLPHTTRAALAGLRKRGFAITRERTDQGGSSRYRIDAGLARAA